MCRWLKRGVSLVALLSVSCGAPHSLALASPSPTASPSASTSHYPSPATTPSGRTEDPPCAETQPVPTFGAAAPSNRNRAIVKLTGSNMFVVRDFTDILHPTNVGTFTNNGVNVEIAYPQFVSANDVSFVDGSLVRIALPGPARQTITPCAGIFGWSPDGIAVAYVSHSLFSSTAQMHVVSRGQNRVVDSMPAFYGGYDTIPREYGDDQLVYSQSGTYLSLSSFGVLDFRIWKSDGTVAASLGTEAHPTNIVWSGDILYYRDDKGIEAWRGGVITLKVPGVKWLLPRASPAGGQIVYEMRDASDVPSVYLLDTATGSVRKLATWRSSPRFLNSHLIWFREERPCTKSDRGPPVFGALHLFPEHPVGQDVHL